MKTRFVFGYLLTLLACAAAETNLYRREVKNPGFAMSLQEVRRDEKTSTIQVISETSGSVSGPMFIMSSIANIARAREARYWIKLKEWKAEDGSSMYLVGFSQDRNVNPQEYFGLKEPLPRSDEHRFMSVPAPRAPREPAAEEKAWAARRTAFVKENLTNFVRVTFLPATNKTETVIQSFKVNDHIVGTLDGSAYYTGVRFTLPDWFDGDLHWIFFHLNPEAQKRQRVDLIWGIAADSGDEVRLDAVRRIDPDDTGEFWKRFPFTRRVYRHTLARTNLQAGVTYALWFAHSKPEVPDVAFAITIDSARGREKFGSIPLK